MIDTSIYNRKEKLPLIYTDYTISENLYNNTLYDIYSFSDNGYGFNVFFNKVSEDDMTLNNGVLLSNHTDINNIIKISFDLDGESYGKNVCSLNGDDKQKDINSKLFFMINEYIKNHDYTTYLVYKTQGGVNNGAYDNIFFMYNKFIDNFGDFKFASILSKNYINNKVGAVCLIKNYEEEILGIEKGYIEFSNCNFWFPNNSN